MMIYENRSSNGVSYRVGTPSKAILISAGMNKVFGNKLLTQHNLNDKWWLLLN